ncbi:hypothetical protein EJB05_21976, partial [Eragrostis curvula]
MLRVPETDGMMKGERHRISGRHESPFWEFAAAASILFQLVLNRGLPTDDSLCFLQRTRPFRLHLTRLLACLHCLVHPLDQEPEKFSWTPSIARTPGRRESQLHAFDVVPTCGRPYKHSN